MSHSVYILPMQGAGVRSLTGKLRSCMPHMCCAAKKKKKKIMLRFGGGAGLRNDNSYGHTKHDTYNPANSGDEESEALR